MADEEPMKFPMSRRGGAGACVAVALGVGVAVAAVWRVVGPDLTPGLHRPMVPATAVVGTAWASALLGASLVAALRSPARPRWYPVWTRAAVGALLLRVAWLVGAVAAFAAHLALDLVGARALLGVAEAWWRVVIPDPGHIAFSACAVTFAAAGVAAGARRGEAVVPHVAIAALTLALLAADVVGFLALASFDPGSWGPRH